MAHDTVDGEGWEDITTSLLASRVGAISPPTLTAFQPGGSGGIYQYAFAKNDNVYCLFHMPHDIDITNPFYFHVHWCTSGTSTQAVGWDLEYSFAKGHGQEAFSTSTTVSLSQAASAIPYMHQVVEMTDEQAVTAKETDSLILLHLKRNTTGSNADTVFGLTVDIHYKSTNRKTTRKAAPFYTS